MKKIIVAIVSATMMLSVTSCAKAESGEVLVNGTDATMREAGIYIPGTYIGNGKGHNGDLTVEVTVTADEIIQIKLTEHTETEGIFEEAEAQVATAIIDKQSVNVDVIAGATYTSKGIMEAVGGALGQAGTEVSAEGFQPGIYTARGSGYNGEMEVTVTLNKSGIEQITAEHVETDGIGTAAIALLTERIVGYQTLDMDTISGATVTSVAYLAAVKDALGAAGVNSTALRRQLTYGEARADPVVKEADVIVIGAGGAGFAAATTAVESGASVIMLDKAEYVGGNTIRAGGTLNAVDPVRQARIGVEDSVDKFYQNIMDAGDQKSDPALARILAEQAMEARQWLEDHGTEWSETVYLTIGGLHTRSMDVKNKNSYKGFIVPLYDTVTEQGGEVIVNCEAIGLNIDADGAVIGVKARDTKNGQLYEFSANSGVVIATGGYGANALMVNTYNDLSGLPTSNAPSATGDGIRLGLDVGAALTGMEDIQIHPHGNPLTGMLQSHFAGDVTNAIYVNMNGERFVNEQGRRDEISNAVIEQPDQIMFSIYDSQCSVYPGVPVYDGMDEMIKKRYVYQADSLEELAARAGIDPDGLKAAVEQYNGLVKSGNDSDFHKKIVEKEIGAGPFYCVPLSPTIHHSMGGLKIDTEARVISADGQPVKGLYAAGEVTGGIHGSNRIGGNAIADCFVFGRIAGGNAAGKK